MDSVSKWRRVVGLNLDILAVETSAALEPDSNAESVRDRASRHLVKFGTGEQALLPFEAHWEVLREYVWEEKTREIVAVSRSNYIDDSKAKLKDLQNARLRSPADVERQFELMQKRLAQDIQLRGDKRIKDPAAAAARFLDDVKARAVEIFTDASDPTHQIMRSHGLDPSQAGPNTTTTDIGDLAAFQHRLRIVSEILAVPFEELKTWVVEEQIPSCVIQGAINRYRQDAQERKGSDLTDNYLACLAAYADITYVDKRTLENIRRAQQKCPELVTLLRRVEKASHYQLILNQLASWRSEGQSNP